jgi:hypothetical protein
MAYSELEISLKPMPRVSRSRKGFWHKTGRMSLSFIRYAQRNLLKRKKCDIEIEAGEMESPASKSQRAKSYRTIHLNSFWEDDRTGKFGKYTPRIRRKDNTKTIDCRQSHPKDFLRENNDTSELEREDCRETSVRRKRNAHKTHGGLTGCVLSG